MTKSWIESNVYSEEQIRAIPFVRNSTRNWMRSLALIVKQTNFSEHEVEKYVRRVKKRQCSKDHQRQAMEKMIHSIHSLSSLLSQARDSENFNDTCRSSIISWYYSIYFASGSMLMAFDGSKQETHMATANRWAIKFAKSKNPAPYPFDLVIESLEPKVTKRQADALLRGTAQSLDTPPQTVDDAHDALIAYLRGTAKHNRKLEEEKIVKSRDFKTLNVNSFRTKKAREIRDKVLSNKSVGFLHQAYRFRGKANYRDSLYLSYDTNSTKGELSTFSEDLLTVAGAFVFLGLKYCEARFSGSTWADFLIGLEAGRSFSMSVEHLAKTGVPKR